MTRFPTACASCVPRMNSPRVFPAVKLYHQEKNSPIASLATLRELEAKYTVSVREMLSLIEGIVKSLEGMSAEATKTATERMKIVDDIVLAQERMILILTLISLAIGILLSVLLTRSITRPLQSATKQLGIMASGDYSQAVPPISTKQSSCPLKCFLKSSRPLTIASSPEVSCGPPRHEHRRFPLGSDKERADPRSRASQD